MKTFQLRLKRALDIRGMEKTDLARLMGVNNSTVDNWFNDKNEINYDTAYKIAKKLKIDPEWMNGKEISIIKKNKEKIVTSKNKQMDIIIEKAKQLNDNQLSSVNGYIDALINMNK